MHYTLRFLTCALVLVHPLATERATADPLQIQSGFVFISADPTQSFGLDFGLFGSGFSFLGEDTTNFDHFHAAAWHRGCAAAAPAAPRSRQVARRRSVGSSPPRLASIREDAEQQPSNGP